MAASPAPFGSHIPFTLVLFGASGHLAKQKLYPALYTLALKKRLPAQYAIVGFARSAMDDGGFRTLVEGAVRADMPEVTERALADFLTHVHYVRGAYDAPADFAALEKHLTSLENGWEEHVRLAYLSVPPTIFPPVLQNLCKAGIPHGTGVSGFRCIVEKPLGHDQKSGEAIWRDLVACFGEESVYLLDHYLGKEAVRNVYYLRHANPVLERIFKNTLIEHVEITASEAHGLEGRAGYFEETGTLRDFVQSHLLQIAALLTMRLQEGDSFRTSRLNALEQFYLPHASSLDDVIVQGQYGAGKILGDHAPGYREESGVRPDSRTNTYIALKLLTRISRWEGVPFYLRTGKRLPAKETRVSILFQEPKHIGEGSTSNRLDIILQGEAGMRLFLQTKLGGTEPRFRPLVMADPLVCVGDCLPEHGMLLLEAIHGRTSWYLSIDEVRAAWRLVDPLQAHLDRPETPLHSYPAGHHPDAAEEWMKKEGRRWME
ncbi:MAG: glucose-6-phosphate 1-dehydrogenase [Candidatus Peregrinibacteria bacterium Gr01-1014_25]|nr:MAG: glucose-6-phosphate 1-dehydrogenase [Candidatus Peregrinibacteria bacterium Gr01-1014_25]